MAENGIFKTSRALVAPPFDVGCFLAQFRNRLYHHPHILASLPEELFLRACGDEAGGLAPDFLRQVELFRARTNLSIAAYLIKVGMEDSADLWRVMLEAERSLST